MTCEWWRCVSKHFIYHHHDRFPLGNENSCNVTSDTKIPISSIANHAFPFSRYCMKPYSKKIWPMRKLSLIITVSLVTYKKCENENATDIRIIRFRIFVSRTNLKPDNTSVVVMTAVALPSLLRFKHHQALGWAQGSNLITRPPVTFGSKIDKI